MGTPIQKLFTDLKNADGTTFVGQANRLWYDPVTGLRVSDGSTPGGLPAVIAVTTASIGQLAISNTTITTLAPNANLNLTTNGTGEVVVTGSFQVWTPGGQEILEIADNGTIQFLAPTTSTNVPAFSIIGNAAGTYQLPQTTGVVLQTSGQQNTPSRHYNDGVNAYSAYIGRSYAGTSSAPQAMTYSTTTYAQNIISRVGATQYTTAGWPALSTARIDFNIRENPTGTAQGTEIQFWTTDIGSTTIAPQLIINNQGISHSANILPLTNSTYDLGSVDLRWNNLYMGPSSIHLQDTVTLADIELKATNGTLFLNGAQNIALGELTIVGNTIQAITPSTQINLGDINDTAIFNIGRPTLLQSTNFASTTSLLTIAGTASTGVPLTNAGTMVHIIAQVGESSRIINDSYGDGLYPLYAGRSAGGTIDNPTSTTATSVLSRLGANGFVAGTGTGTGYLSLGSARIDFVASENFTPTNRGTHIDFYTTPIGSTTIGRVGSFSDTGLVIPAVTFSSDSSVQTTAGVPANTVGISNGIAQLGPDGRLATNQIPSSLLGAVQFAGGWDANANDPPLSNDTGTTGTEYVITVSGTRSLGTQTGNISYLAGGFVIYGGGVWNYTPSVSNFTSIRGINHISVNTGTGVIQITSDATPNNTTATIVARDSSGNFQANIITANLSGNVSGNVTGSLTGNAQTASKLNSAVSINDVAFDGSANIQVNNTSTLTIGNGLTGSSYNGSSAVTIALNTATLMANAVTAAYAYSFNTSTLVATSVYAQTFNTSTLVANAVTAQTSGKLTAATTINGVSFDGSSPVTVHTAGTGISISGTTVTNIGVTNLTSGYDISVSASTGSVTVNNTFTSTSSTAAAAYTLNFNGPSFIAYAPSSNANVIITPQNFVPGRIIKMFITYAAGAQTFSVTGLPTANSFNGSTTFQSVGGPGAPTSMLATFFCTSSTVSGLYLGSVIGGK